MNITLSDDSIESMLKERKEDYEDKFPTQKQLNKLNDVDLQGGNQIQVIWKKQAGEDNDYGYIFKLPMCDENDDLDFFFHIPSPSNNHGIGEVPEVFGHLCSLLKNVFIKEIRTG